MEMLRFTSKRRGGPTQKKQMTPSQQQGPISFKDTFEKQQHRASISENKRRLLSSREGGSNLKYVTCRSSHSSILPYWRKKKAATAYTSLNRDSG